MQDSDLRRNVYVSDRRWKNIVKLLKASAFVHGRTEVSMTDLLPVYHCLWSEPDESVAIRGIVIRALFSVPHKTDCRYRLLAEIRFESQPCARSHRQARLAATVGTMTC